MLHLVISDVCTIRATLLTKTITSSSRHSVSSAKSEIPTNPYTASTCYGEGASGFSRKLGDKLVGQDTGFEGHKKKSTTNYEEQQNLSSDGGTKSLV